MHLELYIAEFFLDIWFSWSMFVMFSALALKLETSLGKDCFNKE